MTDALLPCPFCGCCDVRLQKHSNAGRGEHSGDDVFSIGCYRCGASVPNRYNEHGRKLLISAWNTRTDISQARIDEAGNQLDSARHSVTVLEERGAVGQARIAQLEAVLEEKDERIEELEQDCEIISSEFESDLWVVCRRLLTKTHFDFSHAHVDGVHTDEFEGHMNETISEIDRADARIAELQEALNTIRSCVQQWQDHPKKSGTEIFLELIKETCDEALQGEKA
jgi:Lar family restriction alleviation protein